MPKRWNDTSLETLRIRLAEFAREREWDQYHTPRNLLLALVGEAGELCELFQWRPEADAAVGLPGFSEGERTAVVEELADVMLYLVRLADMCGVDLGQAALRKMSKNAAKYPADRCRGSSAKYTEYRGQRAAAGGQGAQDDGEGVAGKGPRGRGEEGGYGSEMKEGTRAGGIEGTKEQALDTGTRGEHTHVDGDMA